ncbi:hypothetical protein ACUTF1_22265, partial [Burkholderia pseudomallei]
MAVRSRVGLTARLRDDGHAEPLQRGSITLLHLLPAPCPKATVAFHRAGILGAASNPKTIEDLSTMSKKLIQIMAVAALSAAASLPAFAGDMNNALGGALGGVARAAAVYYKKKTSHQ